MWDFKSPIEPLVERRMQAMLSNFSLKLSHDEFYGVYTVTEAAGYIPPIGGADFVQTYQISLGIWCWLPWLPPKAAAEQEYIIARRDVLFRGASENPQIRVQLAARVNRTGFGALKSGQTNLRPFDLFNFI
jgi:hypothetical protein